MPQHCDTVSRLSYSSLLGSAGQAPRLHRVAAYAAKKRSERYFRTIVLPCLVITTSTHSPHANLKVNTLRPNTPGCHPTRQGVSHLQQAGKHAETVYLQQVHGSSTHHETSTGGGGGGTQQTGLAQQSPAFASLK